MSKSESEEQATLKEFRSALELREESSDDVDEKPSWEPGESAGPDSDRWVECELCDNWVTAEFARVFGDNENRLINGCPECSTYREIRSSHRVGSGVGTGGGGL